MFVLPFLLMFFVMLIVGGGILTIYIFYLLTLSRALKQCAPHNQKMSPGEVWMVFIPLFGLVWHFIVIGRVADSLAAEFHYRRIPCDEQRPGYDTGLWALILMLVPFISIVGLVFWILYWVKISGYKKTLEQSQFQFGGGNPYPPHQFQQQGQQYPAGSNQYRGPSGGANDMHL